MPILTHSIFNPKITHKSLKLAALSLNHSENSKSIMFINCYKRDDNCTKIDLWHNQLLKSSEKCSYQTLSDED